MNPSQSSSADALTKMVDRHSPATRAGQRESHDLESLSRRILAPIDACQAFIERGVLTPANPLTRDGADGKFVFSSDDLNDVRKLVLAEIVAEVIEKSDGDADGINLAAGHALKEHCASYGKLRATPKEFSCGASMNGAVMLGVPEEDEEKRKRNGLLKTATKVAIGAGVAGAGLYGLGHLAMKKATPGATLQNIGIGERLKAGWRVAKAGTVGAAIGGTVGGAAGGAIGVSDAMKKLRALMAAAAAKT